MGGTCINTSRTPNYPYSVCLINHRPMSHDLTKLLELYTKYNLKKKKVKN
jgi:hypothetical protein